MKFKMSIRLKLIFSFLFVVVLTGASSIAIGYYIIINNIYSHAYSSVQSHLNSTEYIYDVKIRIIHMFMDHLASLDYIQEAVRIGNRGLIEKKLIEVKDELALDILNIADAQGNIIARAANPKFRGDSVRDDLFIDYVIKNKKSCWGSDIMTKEYLSREGDDLARRAGMKIVKTRMSRPNDKDYEERGLMQKAASPIYHKGKLVGIIYGARLLNGNFEIVDRIQNLVFKNEKIEGHFVGNATIFLDDVRISTNVKLDDNTRAVGTRVSEEVYKKVVEQGEVWLYKAFVVNKWYISAYSPIRDPLNKVIGILYVGMLEDKYDNIKKTTNVFFFLMTVITASIAIVLSLYIIRSVITPYKVLVNASKAIAGGDYSTKIEITSKDEVSYLAAVFNKMVSAIEERDIKLKEQTQAQLTQSEKLASLGRLASGIAHEINNPLTGILTYSSLLLEDCIGTKYQDDLQVIVNETMRCKNIVRGILEFARETRLEMEMTDINRIILDTLSIMEHHVNFQNIHIHQRLSGDIPEMNLDINQLKSVISNLAVNAADAMPGGGELTITTGYDKAAKIITIEVKDTGIGISEKNIGKIFEPFFTTKDPGKGTGLGMAVTYGIIKRHNGTIEVESAVGIGTKFTIKLPAG